ncbi:MAG: thiamine pyrophosphate-dependent dehydrogenase E1 component subunit alpha [Nitrospinota bacterium]
MRSPTPTATSEPARAEELRALDFYRDLADRYLAIEGLEARWVPIRREALRPDKETALRLHRLLSLTRAVEETLDSAFRAGHIPGTAFFGRGNEATSVASAFCLRDEEWLVPMHRNCGAHLAKGHPPTSIMAHFFGRADGPSQGRDGNFHMGYRPKRITQLISHIGTMVPIAAGIAWAAQLKRNGQAVLTYIGDGGTSTGDFHEAINFAAVRKFPLVVVIDNNQYAYKTPLADQYACPTLALRAPGYGIPGFLIDGTDALVVRDVVSRALDRARRGGGPTLIESVTMRLGGHSIYDRYTDYADLEKLKLWQEHRDPIRRYDRYLVEYEVATPEEIAASHARARKEAEGARDAALQSPWPDPAGVAEGVFAE